MLCIIVISRIEKNPHLLSLSFSLFLKTVCISIGSTVQKLLQRNRCSSRFSHFRPGMEDHLNRPVQILFYNSGTYAQHGCRLQDLDQLKSEAAGHQRSITVHRQAFSGYFAESKTRLRNPNLFDV